MTTIHFKTLESTNLYIKKNYEQLSDFQVVSTSHQTEGKGRFGNCWIDDHESALFSILIKRELKLNVLTQIPLIAATACHKVLSQYVSNLSIKWPNDLLVYDKKIAGILTESILFKQSVRALIVGIGINVSDLVFKNVLKGLATSILIESNTKISISKLIEDISSEFQKEFLLFEKKKSNSILYCKNHSYLLGKEISFIQNGIESYGIAIDINDLGHLVVKTKDGILELNSGLIKLNHIK